MEENSINYIKTWQLKNKDKLRKYSKKYYIQNKDKFKSYYENYKKKKVTQDNDNSKNKYIKALERENNHIIKLKNKAEKYKILLKEQGYNIN